MSATTPEAILGPALMSALDAAGYVVRKKPATRRTVAPVEAFAPNTGDPRVDDFMRKHHDPKYKPLPLPKAPGLPPLRPMKVSEQDAAEAAWNAECARAAAGVAAGRPSRAEIELRTLIALHRPAA